MTMLALSGAGGLVGNNVSTTGADIVRSTPVRVHILRPPDQPQSPAERECYTGRPDPG